MKGFKVLGDGNTSLPPQLYVYPLKSPLKPWIYENLPNLYLLQVVDGAHGEAGDEASEDDIPPG